MRRNPFKWEIKIFYSKNILTSNKEIQFTNFL